MKAALLNAKNEVIGEVYDAPTAGNFIEVAGAFTANGEAVNVKSYKISRSVKNMKKAAFEQPVSKIDTKYGPIWTFFCIESNTVVY